MKTGSEKNTTRPGATSGYSGTPLVKKLGIKEGFKIKVVNAPDNYLNLLPGLPENIEWVSDRGVRKNFIHYFATDSRQLERDIVSLKHEIVENGIIWISWPKKAAKEVTNLSGNIVRSIGLNNGLVDIKVCAVDEIWSGLKFVIPVKERKQV